MLIPEQWKRNERVYPSHVVQLGCYLISIAEETGVQPTHGNILLESAERVWVENADEPRADALSIVDQIRAARRQMIEIIHLIGRRRSADRAGSRIIARSKGG